MASSHKPTWTAIMSILKFLLLGIWSLWFGLYGVAWADLSRDPSASAGVLKTREAVAGSIVKIKVWGETLPVEGTGFVIDPVGIIVTNFHLIYGADRIETRLRDGQTLAVEQIAVDALNDIAFLRINTDHLPAVELGDSDQLRAQEDIFVFPDTEEDTWPVGVYQNRLPAFDRDILRFSVKFNHRHDGSPLLNSSAQVVGMSCFSQKNSNAFSYAVSINRVKRSLAAAQGKFDDLAVFKKRFGKVYALYISARNFYFTGDTELAVVDLQKAIALDPQILEPLLFLGELYNQSNKIEEALVTSRMVLKLDPDNVEAHFNIAAAYLRLGKSHAALRLLEKAQRSAPQQKEIPELLGRLFAQRKLWRRAISEYEKALAAGPQYGPAHDGMAQAYFQLGEYALAVEHCDLAIKWGHPVEADFLDRLQPYRP